LNEDLVVPEKVLLKKYVREGKMNGLELSEKGLSAVKQNMAKLEEAKSAYRNRVKVSGIRILQICYGSGRQSYYPKSQI